MRLAKFIIAALLAAPLSAVAGKPNPAEYTLPVHVRETSIGYGCNDSFLGNPSGCGMRLLIVAIVEGQKLELRASTSKLLRTGDYKAKVKKDEQFQDSTPSYSTPSYVDYRFYEFYLPDGKVMTFQVVGESQD